MRSMMFCVQYGMKKYIELLLFQREASHQKTNRQLQGDKNIR